MLHFTVANGDSRCGVRLAQSGLVSSNRARGGQTGPSFEVSELYCSISVTSLRYGVAT
jgi:hypothetical protein